MPEVVNLQTRESLLKTAIEVEISRLGNAQPLALVPPMSEATKLYVQKLQGRYNVDRAKHDTDNAIDLLCIAYNTTPQTESDLRNKIRNIMDRLVDAQRRSQVAMGNVINTTNGLQDDLGIEFDVWSELRTCASDNTVGVKKITDYVSVDLATLAKNIQAQALEVKTQLEAVAATYDRLIADTSAATTASETALGKRLNNAAALAAEINKAKAKRLSLDKLVKDLAAQVDAYDKKAKEFAGMAATAEERAFIMSIVQVGAQMVSAAIPAIVTALTAAATGGTSVVAAAAASTIKRAVGDDNPTAAKPDPTDADLIKTKKALAEKTSEAKQLATSIDQQKTSIKGLEDELKAKQEKEKESKPKDVAAVAAAPAPGPSPAKPEATPGTAETVVPAAAADSAGVTALKQRVDAKKKDLKADEDKHAGLIAALSGLQASLGALEKGLGQISQKAAETATGLREMQMKMLDKVETYEKERRTQNAELVEITALLSGQMNAQDTLQLSIQCLNVSQSALKRTQEIITEIAVFFTSFAAFMGQIAAETTTDVKLFEKMASRVSLAALVTRTDKFFLRQGAEWHAVAHVSGRFNDCFSDGYSKLIKLAAHHLYDEELKAYLGTAKQLIETIVFERETAANSKVVELKGLRAELTESATKTA